MHITVVVPIQVPELNRDGVLTSHGNYPVDVAILDITFLGDLDTMFTSLSVSSEIPPGGGIDLSGNTLDGLLHLIVHRQVLVKLMLRLGDGHLSCHYVLRRV
jgi:hypothetical protein